MADQAPTLEELRERLSRFDEHAARVAPDVAHKVRAVLAERIAELGGAVPSGVDLERSPRAIAAAVAEAAVAEAPDPVPDPWPASSATVSLDGLAAPPDSQEFDFDLDETPASGDNRAHSRGPVFDHDNPRVEDLSQFDLAPDLFAEETAGGSLAFQLDDVPPADEQVAPARLVVNTGTDREEAVELSPEQGDHTLGRGRTCQLRLRDARASRQHCRVFVSAAGKWAVEDLGSANGTQLNGAFLTARTPTTLSTGDEISVGSTEIRFELVGTVSMA